MKRSFGPVTVVAVLLGVGLTAAASGQTSVVQYEAIFDATWSEQTHPKDFPPNPHFSGLIGGTHNDQVAFWKEGELATPGIRLMAEAGSKSPLDSEIQAAISAGTAYSLISGGGIGHSPGVVSVEFEISETHPLVALVSMIAPSPDWFVGVSGVSLRENEAWRQEVVVNLDPYDAGTDSGTTYLGPTKRPYRPSRLPTSRTVSRSPVHHHSARSRSG